jgi:phosphatidylserine/phosphatidylglycerophosphate/cardiolipin synthase-like enzyme
MLVKQTGRFDESMIQASMDTLFRIAQSKMETDNDKKVITGLRAMVRELENALYQPHPRYQDAFFFPSMPNIKKVQKYISMAKKSIDLAIFSFTNDDLANEILAAHKRGVTVRIITDDEAMKGKGADTQRMADAGIPCRTDSEEQYHMHNKFMIVDKFFILTGSFNWTFQAGKGNQENVVVLDGQYYIDKYVEEFNRLWAQFANNKVDQQQEQAALKIQKKFRSNQARERGERQQRKRQNADGWNHN